MLQTRVIPCLLLRGRGLVKGVNFKDHQYLGDPINAVRIFNEKEVDELIFLDIVATRENRIPDLEHISNIADECYMPFTVGGGINTVEHIRDILSAGAEKVSINTAAVENPSLIREASDIFGSQSIVVSIDCKKTKNRYEVYTHSATKSTALNPVEYAVKMEELGVGEILLTSVDREGTRGGYDIELIKMVSDEVHVPVIASGGAGKLEDFAAAVKDGNASAVAAGSFFVFHGRRKAVLISYPPKEELEKLFI